MITIKLSSVNAHPKEIFKALEDRRAEIEWALKEEKVVLPKYEKPPKIKWSIRGVLKSAGEAVAQLQP